MITLQTHKKLIFIMLVAILLFTSCSASAPALLIGNSPVDDEVYAYFLNSVIDKKGKKTSSEIIIDATEGVRYYVKVNTSAAKRGIILSPSEKTELSERLSDFWAVYGNYYNKIGISKQTVHKIFESEAYETSLLKAYYGEGGQNQASEEDVLSCLNKYFIVFKSINGYFTETKENGEISELSELDKELLTADYEKAAKQISDGELTFEAAASRLSRNHIGNAPETVVLKRGSPYYSGSFFDEVAAAKADTAIVVVCEKNVFLVIKESIEVGSDYFTDNYLYALRKLKGEELKSLIASESSYQANVFQSKAESIYNRIIKTKGGNDCCFALFAKHF